MVDLTINPAPAGYGVRFQRSDRPEKPILKATLDAVQATPRCTIIGDQQVQVRTVEHLLAALRAFHIDNALIVLNGSEVPIGDGSAAPFCDLIKMAGIETLEMRRDIYTLSEPVCLSRDDGVSLVAFPSSDLRISYTLHYSFTSQFYAFCEDEEIFEREIAPCRTFCLYEEIEPLIREGYLKGGSLESALVIADGRLLNPDGFRFRDEMARHKILDLFGDLSLMQIAFSAHILAVRSGHATNVAFAKLLYEQLTNGETLS
jgi:UDP-3-O-[3-hydroxymyristoyl] N-acetylglucosamine deacetylase